MPKTLKYNCLVQKNGQTVCLAFINHNLILGNIHILVIPNQEYGINIAINATSYKLPD